MKHLTRLMTVVWTAVASTTAADDAARASLVDVGTIPGVETELHVQTIPNASCELYAPGQPEEALEVSSDENGEARVDALLDPWQKAVEVVLDCRDEDGAMSVQKLRVRAGTPAASARRERAMRPALQGDPHAFTDAELRAGGYPRRPRVEDAARYARWLDAVSRPAPTASARRVPGRMRQQTIRQWPSTNWSGFMIEAPRGVRYAFVEGEWQVPKVLRSPSGTNGQYSSMWVGLDDGPGIYQAGTEHDVLYLLGATFKRYAFWMEVYPAPLFFIPDFPVHAGDNVTVRVWAGNRDGDFDPDGSDMWFEMDNWSQGAISTSGSVYAAFVDFKGDRAEWVLERPTRLDANGNELPLYTLPNYGVTNIGYAHVYDENDGWRDLYTDTINKIKMVDPNNGDATISAIQRTSSLSMKFTWHESVP